MGDSDKTLLRILSIPPRERTPNDLLYLHSFFRTVEGLSVTAGQISLNNRDAELRELCRIARHMNVPGDHLLYQSGDLCDAWYILLSGCVLIESSMYLPRACFGMRSNVSSCRTSDCLVLEPSDLVAIDYPTSGRMPLSYTNTHRHAVTNHKRRLSHGTAGDLPHASTTTTTLSLITPKPNHSPVQPNPPVGSRISFTAKPTTTGNRLSELNSDTFSAQSFSSSGYGGDSSIVSGGAQNSPSTTSSYGSGSVVEPGSPGSHIRTEMGSKQNGGDSSFLDSDEEESVRDAFWESILKEPSKRTEEDIEIIMDNVQQLPAFSNLTKTTCRALCSVMALAVVQEAGQVVLGHDEPLDTWSVVLNGTVEVVDPDGTIRELIRGDSFGVRAGKDGRTHRGVMRTVTEDCQFACVPQANYFRIMSREGEAEIPEMEEGGRVVLVYEAIPTTESPNASTEAGLSVNRVEKTTPVPSSKGRVVIKGTPEKLIEHLVADLSHGDSTYPEDFLLTYRTFLDHPRSIVVRLLSWHMHNPKLRPRVNRIVLLWVYNHFNDFEDSAEMMKFVEKFDGILTSEGTAGERRLFQLACSTKARSRLVEIVLPVNTSDSYSRPCSDCTNSSISAHVIIPFRLTGGQDGFGLFIDQVDASFATALENNTWNPSGTTSTHDHPKVQQHIRRADQLLEVNGRSVDSLRPSEVEELIQAIGTKYRNNRRMSDADLDTSIESSLSNFPPDGRPTCHLKLSLVYNPLHYYQFLHTLNSRATNGSIAPTMGTLKPNRPLNENSVEKDQKFSLPCSNSVSHGLGSNGPRLLSYAYKQQLASFYQSDFSGDGGASNRSTHSTHSSPTRSEIPIDNGKPTQSPPYKPLSPVRNRPSNRSPSPTTRHQFGVTLVSSAPIHRSQRSSSQPDLTALNNSHKSPPYPSADSNFTAALPSPVSSAAENNPPVIIRVWLAGKDQSAKLIALRDHSVTAAEAVQRAAAEFGIPLEERDSYHLCHVSVEAGPVVKQNRLAPTTDDLAGRMTLNARYYLKKDVSNHNPNQGNESIILEDVAKSILTESRVTFAQLAPEDLAIQLTLDDYEVFRAVQSTEYVDEVFGLTATASATTDGDEVVVLNPTGYASGHANLDRFTELVNREAYWVPTELCAEPNLNRRVDLLKRFIKLAKLCRELRNFNTMFCLLVGLHQTPVERLRQTWERLPAKYQKIYRDLSRVLDTSRNFIQYRNLFLQVDTPAPMIPYLPLVLKDLTFIHLGNPSRSPEDLINFVKLRMIAKEVRSVCRMCNVEYDLITAQRLLGRSTLGNRAKFLASGGARPVGGHGRKTSMPINGFDPISADDAKRVGGTIEDGRSTGTSTAIDAPKRSAPSFLGVGSNPGLNNATMGGSALLGLPAFLSGNRRRSGGRSLIMSGFPSFTAANTKKIYEAWLVTLRIRTYLSNITVVQDSETLSQMSARLEPKDGKPSTNSTVPVSGWSKDLPSPNKVPETPPKSTPSSGPNTSNANHTSTTSLNQASLTKNETAPLRPILGALTLEDSQKLMALTQGHPKRYNRTPSITFPTNPHLQPPSSTTHLMYVAPPTISHSGVGLGPLQYSNPHLHHHHTNVAWSPACGSSNSRPNHPPGIMVMGNPHRPHSPSTVHQHLVQPTMSSPLPPNLAQQYTVLRSKSSMLYNLIPIPRRIEPARLAAGGGQLQRIVPSHHYHHAVESVCNGCGQHRQHLDPNSHIASQTRLSSCQRTSMDRSSVSVRQPALSESHPTHTQQHFNQLNKSACLTPSTAAITQFLFNDQYPPPPLSNGHSRMLTANAIRAHKLMQDRQNTTGAAPLALEESYRYPTANMHPLGVPLHQQRRTGPRINPHCLDQSKPHRPPSYELALTLKQQQFKPDGQLRPSLLQVAGRLADKQSRASAEPLSIPRNVPYRDDIIVDHHPLVDNVSIDRLVSTKSYHPPGVPKPIGQQHQSSDVPLTLPSRSNQRAAPPSYQQVLAMSRYGHSQSQSNSDRPTPPTRTVAALSSTAARSASASPGVNAVRLRSQNAQPNNKDTAANPRN